jgi:broad specificity phosphatase PhoE
MRIGLIRHFPVEQPLPSGWMTAEELQQWRTSYDSAKIIPKPLDLTSGNWSACLSSDLDRAIVTAKAAYAGEVEITPLLREPELALFRTGRLRLPVWVWRWVLRFSWMMGHRSQRRCRDEFRSRVSAVADALERREGDTLVVSHAGMMAYLSAVLTQRGYSGPKLRVARHAHLYVYEKNHRVVDPVAPSASSRS